LPSGGNDLRISSEAKSLMFQAGLSSREPRERLL
jgi:hypothetical protein